MHSLDFAFPYKARLLDSVLIWENASQGCPWHISVHVLSQGSTFFISTYIMGKEKFPLILLSKIFLLHKQREQARTSLTTPQVPGPSVYFYS